MQDQQFRLATLDSDGSLYEGPSQTANDAYADLAITTALHALGRWRIERCSCGDGATFRKGGLVRVVHLFPASEEESVEAVESLALAVGVLAPGSHVGGLVAVGV